MMPSGWQTKSRPPLAGQDGWKMLQMNHKRNGHAHQDGLYAAIPPDEIRRLIEEAINRHLDQDQFAILKVAEESEREQLRLFVGAA
jgi:hypothetical protein